MNLGVPVRTVRVKKPEDENLNDSVGTTTMMERTGKSRIGSREAFLSSFRWVTSKDKKKTKKTTEWRGFFLRTLNFEPLVSVNDDMFRGTSAMA